MLARVLTLLLLLASPASASLVDSYRYSSGANRCAALGATVTSTVADLDATCSSSYSGTGQLWSNLESTPADSAAQSAYNFDLGTSNAVTTDDPGFAGTADTADARFTVDGGDWFELNGSNTQFIKDMSKDPTGGTDFWVAMVFKQTSGATTQGLWGNSNSTTTDSALYASISSAEVPIFNQRGATANVASTGLSAFSDATYYCVIFSFSHSTNTLAYWRNSATGSTQSLTMNTSTAETAVQQRIGRSTGSSNVLNSGSEIKSFSMGNTYLDDTEAAKIFAVWDTRYSGTLDCTP